MINVLKQISGFVRFHRKREWKEPVIILSSIPKSGTNYLRLILANYLSIFYNNIEKRISYTEMHNVIFPNIISKIINGDRDYIPLSLDHPIINTGYYDFMYSHGFEFLKYVHPPNKIIHLYRNPLDNIVSRFFYFWKNRPEEHRKQNTGTGSDIISPSDFIDYVLEDYISQYSYFKRNNYSNSYPMPYEDLFRQPFESMVRLLTWLDIVIDECSLEKAIVFSSKDNIRMEEKEMGKAIHSPQGYKGSFVRNGSVGEWKKHFSEMDVNYIQKCFRQKGIDLNEFIIE